MFIAAHYLGGHGGEGGFGSLAQVAALFRDPWALLAGWAAGMTWATQMAVSLHLKGSVYPLHLFGGTYAMYAAVPALLLNLAVSLLGTLLARVLQAPEALALAGVDAA